MVNPNKVRLMTKVSSYEKKNKKKLENLDFFKHDYIGFNVFLTLVGVAFSLLLFFLADLGTKFVADMQNFVKLDFVEIGTNYAMIAIAVAIVYGILSTLIYRKKYHDSVEVGDKLERMIKKLSKF